MVSTEALLDYLESGRLTPSADSGPTDPLRAYAIMYTMCFLPATESYMIHSSRQQGAAYYNTVAQHCQTQRIDGRKRWWVMSGAMEENVDDMLELALRLSSGVGDANLNIAAASKLLRRVYEGPFPTEKKAVAASAICYLFLNCDDPDEPGEPCPFRHWCAAIGFAADTCRLGLFSFVSVLVADTALGMGMGLGPPSERDTLPDLQDVLKHFDEFREETGYRPYKSGFCSQCLTEKPKETLRQCAGPCDKVHKPVYCGRDCQKAAWSKHKKWCKQNLMVSRNVLADTTLYSLHLMKDNHTTVS